MDKMVSGNKSKIFAALKLIEQLYKDNEIPDYMFRNILIEYANGSDIPSFLTDSEKGMQYAFWK